MIKNISDIPLPAPVFRVLPDPFSASWCLELREGKKPFAAWARVNVEHPESLVLLEFPNAWSNALQDFAGNVIVLGKYEASGMPVIRGLSAWVEKGKMLWEIPEGKSLKRSGREWRCQQGENIVLKAIPESDKILKDNLISPSLYSPEQLPVIHIEQYFPGIKLLKQAEYLEYTGYKIISVFTEAGAGLLDQHLLILKGETAVFRERIMSGSPGFSLDTWCVRGRYLYFIQDKNRWRVLEFTSESQTYPQ